MNIVLIPLGRGQRFTFASLPEKISGRYGAKYQTFDIINKGTVKVQKGTDVSEFSWNHVFFGPSKKGEAFVKEQYYMEPNACVNILNDFMLNETVLNLIVTETWINVDVTISALTVSPAGAYGNVEYSITFVQKKPLLIYTTAEMNIDGYAKKTRPRNDSGDRGAGSYTVVSGDTLWGISARHCGGGANWPTLYNANEDVIEAEARKHGKTSSNRGHWIWSGEVLQLV